MKSKFSIKKYLFIILSIINILILIKTRIIKALLEGNINFIDWDNYYFLCQAIFKKQDPYHLHLSPTLGPPLVFLFLLPLAIFSLKTSRQIIVFLNLTFFFLMNFYLSKRLFSKKEFLLVFSCLTLIILLTFPARFNIMMGQINFFSAFLITFLLSNKKNWLSGFFLALLATFKTYFLLPFFAWFRKEKSKVVFFAFFLTLFFLLSLFFIGHKIYFNYFSQKFLTIVIMPSFSNNLDYYNQSLKSTLSRLGISLFFPYLYFLFLIGSIIYLIISTDFKTGIALSLLLSPVCWQHYFVNFYPLLIWEIRKTNNWGKIFLLIIAFFLMAFQWSGFHYLKKNFFTGFLASHYFWGALIFIFYLMFNKKRL